MASTPSDQTKANGGRGHEQSAPDIDQLIREHPLAAAAVAVSAALLVKDTLTATTTATPSKSAAPRARPSRTRGSRPKQASEPRTHDVGAADMEFTKHHADGRKIEFRFKWKKRPTDDPEVDWEPDQMGFTSDGTDGTRTQFSFTKKVRPIPDRDAPGYRPGLGQLTMEFVSSRPGSKDFRFTWDKPPDAAGTHQRKNGS